MLLNLLNCLETRFYVSGPSNLAKFTFCLCNLAKIIIFNNNTGNIGYISYLYGWVKNFLIIVNQLITHYKTMT